MGKSDCALTLARADRFDLLGHFHMDLIFQPGKNYDAQDVLSREMYYPAVALFVLLKDRRLNGRVSLVVNTHLLYNIKKGHVKLGELVLILKAVERLKADFPVQDVYFCGDFNLIANSMLYSYIATGELNLEVDLHCFSNQAFAQNHHRHRPLEEALSIEDYRFKPSKALTLLRIDPKFVTQLAACRVEYGQGPELVFVHDKGAPPTMNEAQAMFRRLSDEAYLMSAYAHVSRETAKTAGRENPSKNYEKGVTFFVNTMASTVDYIWHSSNFLVPNQILQKPRPSHLETLPRTGPVDSYPSDHFCLFAGFVIKEAKQ